MPTKYDPVSLDSVDAMAKINTEISKRRELNAILLIHGFLEAYLHQLFILELGSIKKAPKTLKDYLKSDGLNLYSLSNILMVIKKIDDQTYKSLIKFNNTRNDYAHNLITKNIDEGNENLKRMAEDGLKLLGSIIEIYKKDIKDKSSKIFNSEWFYGRFV